MLIIELVDLARVTGFDVIATSTKVIKVTLMIHSNEKVKSIKSVYSI